MPWALITRPLAMTCGGHVSSLAGECPCSVSRQRRRPEKLKRFAGLGMPL